MPLLDVPDGWDAQPDYFPAIRYDDPIGPMARFILIGGYSPVEISAQVRPGGTLSTARATAGGIGYVLPTVATTWAKSATGLDPYIGDSFTICWYGTLRDDSIQQLLTFGSGYGWRLKTSNWGPGQLRVGLEQFWGGSLFSALLSVVDNTSHTLVLRYNGAAVAMDLFFDGVFVATIANIKDGGAIMANPTFSMLGEASGTKPHVTATVQVFAGLFTDGQVRAWSQAPYHIFEESESFQWIPAGGGVPPPTFQAAWARNSNAVITGMAR